jgi:hypothetical protein
VNVDNKLERTLNSAGAIAPLESPNSDGNVSLLATMVNTKVIDHFYSIKQRNDDQSRCMIC